MVGGGSSTSRRDSVLACTRRAIFTALLELITNMSYLTLVSTNKKQQRTQIKQGEEGSSRAQSPNTSCDKLVVCGSRLTHAIFISDALVADYRLVLVVVCEV